MTWHEWRQRMSDALRTASDDLLESWERDRYHQPAFGSMNERNVDALAALLAEEASEITGPLLYQLAGRLAARGVLVPMALTDNEIALEVWDEGTEYVSGEDRQDYARPNVAGLRSALERIAKGEPVAE